MYAFVQKRKKKISIFAKNEWAFLQRVLVSLKARLENYVVEQTIEMGNSYQ